jgi:zinc protease
MKHLNQFVWAVLFVSFFSTAQDLNAPIPFDPAVRTGKLSNGLTYYIRKNAKPEKKVDLRLVINAGSILEDDNQQGLAHFMEHMCFNGTKRFPKNQLVDYLQSIGVKFGQHLNAYTSFDETVYFLPIPADNPEKIEKGFQILEDWAFNANLTPEEIDKERGVVLEEYRLGLGADKRMEDRYIPKMMYNSQYAVRLPIGKKEILENFTYDKLTSFYRDWYRPNLMSVIVVGDIDVDAMEQKIKEHFSAYKNPVPEKPRKLYDVPNHKQTLIAIERDKEATNTQVQLMYKDFGTPKVTRTIGDYKRNLTEGLFTTMLNNRLEELVNSSNPPFTFGYSYHGSTFARTKEAYQSFAMTQEDKLLEALRVLVYENERAKKYGFTPGEFERAKKTIMSRIESRLKDKDKQESEDYVWQYQSHFLENTPCSDVVWSHATTMALLPQITLEEVNVFLKDYIKAENRVVVLTAPEKETLAPITEKAVLETLEIDPKTIKPYEDTALAQSLLRTTPKPGSIVRTTQNEALGTKTLWLSNGARVTYKKTDFKNDEVLIEAVSFGGTNLYADADFKKTQYANFGLTEAGFSGLKTNDISKFMMGKIANVSPYIQNFTEGFRGDATPQDLEYVFQMIHAYFTDLNFDPAAFEGYKQKQAAFVENISAQPTMYFQQELYTALNANNPRFNGLFPNAEKWAQTDYALAYQKYKERFANAGDFEFFLVGNIDEQALAKFAITYIASLPGTEAKESVRDTGYRMLSGDMKKVVRKGKDPKSNVQIMFYGEAPYDTTEALQLRALGEVLTIKLVEQLRETESGVYGVNARGMMSKYPFSNYNFNISFPCGPENIDKLTASALQELQKMITQGPEEKDLNKFKEAELLEHKKQLKENQYWLTHLTRSYMNNTDGLSLLKLEQAIQSLTTSDLQKVAQKYLTKNKVVGQLLPE